ncbi:MAG: hypothetical protein A3B38_02405 [Candidatus Levybacteria bacterium RIFCSPLOWO2_01_FULL_36_13]|nr:MAG: hypothetical protein A2684_03600 [Candidatus Levybacteria bacterium RIFCSPHIGHO2_01_FULL_36_15b]OGH35137.1 MAG: hypothetical protein A3B38_02405 [Candidatus Levybacteria bacterium RIFCSPLOWO2_01_FULL_36_13]
MNKIESGFIPLPKVEREQPLDNVYFNFNLPQFVDQDRIGVNIGRVDRINNLSGIFALKVEGKTDLDQSSEEHNVVGVNSDGSALASKSKTKNIVPTADIFARGEFNHFEKSNSRSVALGLALNISEITSRIQLSNKNIRESDSWSKEIDKALREKLRKGGTDNLVKLNTFEKWWFPFAYGIMPGTIFAINGTFPMVYYSVIYSLDKFFDILKHRDYPETRISLFPSVAPQLDRAAALQVLTRTQKLVSDLQPDKK